MSEWSKFEDYVNNLTKKDETKRTPLSGATKQEEDVVGKSLICQCKQTEDKNISILSKDIDRLLKASIVLDKFPLFFSSSKAGKLLSIPITTHTEDIVKTVINFIIAEKSIELLELYNKYIKSIKSLNKYRNEVDKSNELMIELTTPLRIKIKKLKIRLNTIEDDLTMGNLFDGL